jgi:hypothetical protein
MKNLKDRAGKETACKLRLDKEAQEEKGLNN